MENRDYISLLQNKDNFELLKHLQERKSLSLTHYQNSKIKKNLSTLEEFHLVKKQENSLILSRLGQKIIQKTKSLDFINSNIDYFLIHSLEEVPTFLIQRIEDISDGKIKNGVWPVSTWIKEITSKSSTLLNCIFSEPPFLLADLIYSKINSGVKFQILFGKNSKVPECNDLVEKLELSKPKTDSMFEKRLCEVVITNVVVSDNGAVLMLGNKNNESDLINAIIGDDEDFINWCNDFFNYKWKQGHEFARLRLATN